MCSIVFSISKSYLGFTFYNEPLSIEITMLWFQIMIVPSSKFLFKHVDHKNIDERIKKKGIYE